MSLPQLRLPPRALKEPNMSQTNGDGNHRPQSLTDLAVVETASPGERTVSSFYDASNPALAPAKPVEGAKRKNWKRKLIGWGLVLLLIGGGAAALYLLLKINRVNVTVQADSHRDNQGAKPKSDSKNTENVLTE